ncbi:MAG: glycosyltransferase family 2 protein [Acidobacteriota bacterium]|nr:MAG: glycosyltransferase family 2 protein [Acidobacteriota bacterium]
MTASPRVESESRPRLSVAVITHNEAGRLPALIDSVRALAGEIVIVDSGSTDGTTEIARQSGARVVVTDWPGFARQKQRALELCRGDWIFSLDADERPDEQLRRALAALPDPHESPYGGFAVDRLTSYHGRYMRHVWSPDWIVRVVRRGAGRFNDALVHERLEVDGPVGRLPGKLLHDSFRDLDDHLRRTIHYARLSAEQMHRRGRRFRAYQLIVRPLAAFGQRYVLKRGFLDGLAGLVVSGVIAAGTFFKYAFLAELQRTPRDERNAGARQRSPSAERG